MNENGIIDLLFNLLAYGTLTGLLYAMIKWFYQKL